MIVQLSSGQGPLECQLAVGLLLNALKKECPDMEMILEKPGQKKDCYTSVQFRTGAATKAGTRGTCPVSKRRMAGAQQDYPWESGTSV